MAKQNNISVKDFKIGNNLPFTLIAGPCVLESKTHAFDMAGALKEIAEKLDIPFIYKSSFDKANRTSINAERGMGIEKGLPIFQDLKKEFNIPIITDVHTPQQCEQAAEVVDILQIPAFLCRQTDLLIAAAKTGKIINVKKAQFLAPWDMKNVAKKIIDSGNPNVMLCERGSIFGYNTLINDMRALPVMAETGCPVIFDATHSVQKPGGNGTSTSGDRTMVPYLARAAMAVGIAGIFMETHQDPDNAPCDGPNMVKLEDIEGLLENLKAIDNLIKSQNNIGNLKAA